MNDKERSKVQWLNRMRHTDDLVKMIADNPALLVAECGCHAPGQRPIMPSTLDGLERWLKSAPASRCRVKNIESQHPDLRTDLPRPQAVMNYWMYRHPNAPASKRKQKFKGGDPIPDVSAEVAESQARRRVRKTARKNALVNPR